MKATLMQIVLSLALVCQVALALDTTPVLKVIELLNNMKAEGQKELEAEKSTFAEYTKWKDGRVQELGFEIKDAKARIEKLTAAAADKDAKVAQYTQAIALLEKEIARLEGEKAKAEKERAAGHADFEKVEKDNMESVDALARAIAKLQALPTERAQANKTMLLQMAKESMALRPAVAAFLEDAEGEDFEQAPQAAAFKTSSGSVIKMLQDLLVKFKAQLADVRKEEAKKANAFQLISTDLSNAVKRSSADKQEKVGAKTQDATDSAKAKGDLEETKKALAEAEKQLADVQTVFTAKSATFAENQKVRQQEIEAITKATEIMSGGTVAGGYQNNVKTRTKLVEVDGMPTSLLQVRSSSGRATLRERAASFLQRRAAGIDSKALALLASDVAANPFTKVIKMMKDMLANLKEQEAAEATHKRWCDEQLTLNKQQREAKQTAVDKLTAKIKELDASIKTMGQQIETLAKEQADLAESDKKATEQRNKEKAQNTKAIQEAQEGTKAVQQAIAILQEFYSNVSLLQQDEGQVPEMKAYKGMQNGKGGVIGMMEVIQSDFLRVEQETKTAETQAQNAYDKLMADSAADKAEKKARQESLKTKKDEAAVALTNANKDLASEKTELAKANEYFESLKPNCVVVPISFEERQAKRKQEIDALKQVNEILTNEAK